MGEKQNCLSRAISSDPQMFSFDFMVCNADSPCDDKYNICADIKRKKNTHTKKNKRTMMVLYRSPEHICNLYGLSRAGY